MDWIGLDWNALFCVDKIVEKKKYDQAICLIKVNVKIIIIIIIIIIKLIITIMIIIITIIIKSKIKYIR